MKNIILIILAMILISCNENQKEDTYNICTPTLSNNCYEVDHAEYERYIEQYQVCEVHKNDQDCLNIYDF